MTFTRRDGLLWVTLDETENASLCEARDVLEKCRLEIIRRSFDLRNRSSGAVLVLRARGALGDLIFHDGVELCLCPIKETP